MKKTTAKLMFIAVMMAVILTTTGCPLFRPSAVGSPNGYTPEGATIWTPNGQYVATKIGSDVVIREDNEEVFRYLGFGSLLKGMAFSPDSLQIAFMHHYSEIGSLIREYQIGNDELYARGEHSGYYHEMRYSQNGESIILGVGTLWSVSVPLVRVSGEGEGEGEGEITDDFQRHSGANLPWINYGWDLGRNPWGGAPGGFSSNVANLNEDFRFLSGHGVGLVRVFLFCDLRSGVLFGDDLLFDDHVYPDMDALAAAADRYHLLLLPVLFDYLLADGVSREGGTAVGEHPELLTTDRDKLISLMSEFLARYGQNPRIYAWEIMNEPEWITRVSQADLATFVAEMAAAIHGNTSQLATLGSKNLASCGLWTGLGLDLYQSHHYDSMGTNLPAVFPPVSGLDLDQPVIVGELQPTLVSDKLGVIQQNGYVGALFWSLNSDYDFAAVADEYAGYFGQ